MTDRLRILTASDTSPVHIRGGAERVLWEQASRLVKRGHRVRVVSRYPAESVAETLEREGVRIQHYPADRRSSARFLLGSILQARKAVTQVLAEEEFDVLQLYQPLSGYGALRSDRARSLPCLYTFLSPTPLEYISRHGMTGHHRPGLIGRVALVILWGIERACLRRATRIHVLSDFSAAQLWKLYRIPSDRIVKIPGGVDIERFRPTPDRGALREALGLPPQSAILLTVRNLEARMGLDALIRAMGPLRQPIPEILLLIGGAGSLRGQLEALTASLGLQQHVRFLDYIPESHLPLYYQAADAFILPTRELEGFGLVTVEALSCGTPVLGTAVGATPEILRPLDSSLILRGTTPEAMADDLKRFFEATRRDSAAAQSLRQACRRHAERHYDWDRLVIRLEETLGQLARGRTEPPVAQPCPVCDDSILEPDVVYRGTPYLRCPRCRTGVVATLATPASMRRQYEVEYPLRFPHKHVAGVRAELFDSILDQLQALGSKGRLLDVGCGGGHLLASAGQRGWRSLGTDLSHDACGVTRQAGAAAVQAEGAALPFRDGVVDAVSLINVLDHTPQPLATLREAHRVLPPGGHLVIRIPNAAFHRPWIRLLSSLGPLIRWRGWDRYPILHLFALTAGGLRSLVDRAGFHVLTIRNSSLAVEEFPSNQKGMQARGLRLLHGIIAASAASVEFLSRGRWLIGPSIELYAERPPHRDAVNP
jgi:glycosyltransferase involved in cell wall biosynthesis/SAM-dependent methyltransferase